MRRLIKLHFFGEKWFHKFFCTFFADCRTLYSCTALYCTSSTEGVQKWPEQRHPMWYYRTWNRRQLILVGKKMKDHCYNDAVGAKSKKFTLNSIVSIFFSRFLYCRLIPSQKSLLLGNDYYIIRTYVLHNSRVNHNFQNSLRIQYILSKTSLIL